MIKNYIGNTDFIISSEDAGKRIDKFLTAKIKEKSRSYIQKLIENKKVKDIKKIVSKNYKLLCNDEITIESTSINGSEKELKPQDLKLNIVYENDYFFIISKDAGLVTHPSPGYNENTLVNALLFYCNKLSTLSGESRAGIIHRLDKDTSGLIIIAKNDEIHRKISEQFKSREVRKTYVALVWGLFNEKEGEIELPIGRSRLDRKKMSVAIDGGKKALTSFKVMEEFNNCSLLNIYPKTGRTHQIRVHFSYIDHPVIGDKKYGNKYSDKLALEIDLNRQFLHAKKLIFKNPVTGEEMTIEDELADELRECLEKLRRNKRSIN